jgi:hypothetical protein
MKLVTTSPTRSMISPRWIRITPLRFQESLKRTECAATRLASRRTISV